MADPDPDGDSVRLSAWVDGNGYIRSEIVPDVFERPVDDLADRGSVPLGLTLGEFGVVEVTVEHLDSDRIDGLDGPNEPRRPER